MKCISLSHCFCLKQTFLKLNKKVSVIYAALFLSIQALNSKLDYTPKKIFFFQREVIFFTTKSAAKVCNYMRQTMQESLPREQKLSCLKELFSQTKCSAVDKGKGISPG